MIVLTRGYLTIKDYPIQVYNLYILDKSILNLLTSLYKLEKYDELKKMVQDPIVKSCIKDTGLMKRYIHIKYSTGKLIKSKKYLTKGLLMKRVNYILPITKNQISSFLPDENQKVIDYIKDSDMVDYIQKVIADGYNILSSKLYISNDMIAALSLLVTFWIKA